MKIVHICITSPFGEIYAYQENLLSHYHRLMGHEVTIIANTYSRVGIEKKVESVGETTLPDGIKLIRLGFVLNNDLLNSHLNLVKGLKKALLSESPDLIFAHDVGNFGYKCFRSFKRKHPNTRIVIDNHGDYINSLHSPISKFLHKVVYRLFLVPSLIKVTDCFYGVTESRCQFLRDIYGIPSEKIKLLVMGADDEKMHINQREQIRERVRNQYNINSDDFLLVTGGKIDRQKNIHVLTHAVNALGRNNVKLLIFGKINDDMRPLFDFESSNQIITIGWIDSDKVYDYFYAADLVIFPGLHSVLWEQAVASKTPCAFSKMRGFEHVNVNNNCILMTGKDSNYYENLINNLIENPDYYDKLRANADSSLTEQFYYSNIAKQVLADVNLL